MHIDSIIFDFGGVLGADANSWTDDNEISVLTGLLPAEIDQIFFLHWDKLKVGKEDLQEFFKEIQTRSHTPVSIEQLREAYHKKITINPDVLNLVKNLAKNYKLFILANESREGMAVKVKKFNLTKYFLKIFSSAELGLAKPDPELFRMVLATIPSSPAKVLFIDDQQKNVAAAKALGITSFVFENVDKLTSDLSEVLQYV